MEFKLTAMGMTKTFSNVLLRQLGTGLDSGKRTTNTYINVDFFNEEVNTMQPEILFYIAIPYCTEELDQQVPKNHYDRVVQLLLLSLY